MADYPDDEDRRIVQEMVGRFDSPSFIRRAKLVETTWTQLLERGAKARLDRLAFVRLRLGQLHALAGGWERMMPMLADVENLQFLQQLHVELQPRLRLPLEPTNSRRTLQAAGAELIEAMETFNERWQRWLVKIDLKPVNKARDDYNRFYVFEKECAVGSIAVARLGFKPVEPITLDDVARHFPPLRLPRFVW